MVSTCQLNWYMSFPDVVINYTKLFTLLVSQCFLDVFLLVYANG